MLRVQPNRKVEPGQCTCICRVPSPAAFLQCHTSLARCMKSTAAQHVRMYMQHHKPRLLLPVVNKASYVKGDRGALSNQSTAVLPTSSAAAQQYDTSCWIHAFELVKVSGQRMCRPSTPCCSMHVQQQNQTARTAARDCAESSCHPYARKLLVK